jgi:hypothetical protein
VDIALDAPIASAPSLVASDAGGEFVILNFQTGKYHGLEEVGALIWKLVSEGTTARKIHARILAEYDVDEARCRADVQRLLNDLHERGLIHVGEVSPS